ncbi:MAG: TonB-dependent receptor, partial [Acidiferrobacterales bacterium]
MEIGRYTPNFQFTTNASGGATAGQAFIRGVGQTDFLITTDPGVGIYLDGVYLARTSGAILDLMDVERIEILRGPQGTLYGKNTIGGAINVVSAMPTGESGGRIDLITGRYGRIDARATVEIPIVADTLAAKVAVSSKNRDGYGRRLDFTTGGKVDEQGDEDNLSARGLLRWTPTDNLDILFALDSTRERNKMSTRTPVAIDGGGLAGLISVLDEPYDDRYLSDDPFSSFATGSNVIELDVWGTSMTVDWGSGGLNLKSITAYRNLESVFGSDPDGSPVVVIDEFGTTNQDQFSQELQFSATSFDGRLDWVAGAYYFQENATAVLDLLIAPGIYNALENMPGAFFPLVPGITCPPPPAAPCAGGAGNPLNAFLDFGIYDSNDIKTRSYAVFGQGTYSMTDKLSITAGLRYTYEKKDNTILLFHPLSGAVIVPVTEIGDSWDSLSPKLGIEYQWTPDFMAYASAARGFKSGGFNGRPTLTLGVQPFNPEYVWTYEMGFKSQWADNRLRLNAGFFYNDYQDMQLTVVGFTGRGPDVRVENAGNAETKGLEIEIAALPLPNLQLNAGIGYTDAKYTKIAPSLPGQSVTLDDKLPETPKWSLNVGAQYLVSLENLGNLTLRADYVYKSKIYHDATNSEVIAQDGFGLVNARLSFVTLDSRWEFAVFGTNLTDERYTLSGVDALGPTGLGFAEAQFGRPREWGASASFRF